MKILIIPHDVRFDEIESVGAIEMHKKLKEDVFAANKKS